MPASALPTGTQPAERRLKNGHQGPLALGAQPAGHHMPFDDQDGDVSGTHLADRHPSTDAQKSSAVGNQPAGRHPEGGNQIHAAPGDQPAGRRAHTDTQARGAPGDQRPGTDRANGNMTTTGVLRDPFLAFAATVLDDIERVRIANENRVRQLTRTEPDEDGELRGFGLPDDHPDVAVLKGVVEALSAIEATATKSLQKRMRKHPLYAFTKGMRGVGDKQVARLLAAIGDPHWHNAENRPRTVSELWAYCGFRPGQKRQRGVKSNWSQDAKMRAYLIAESCLKQLDKATCPVDEDLKVARHADGCRCSPYRVRYDARKLHTRSTQPDWTDLHRHNDALRIVAKTLLLDLWRAARDLNGGDDAADQA